VGISRDEDKALMRGHQQGWT